MLISFSYLRLAILLTKLPHLSGKVTGAAIFLFLDIQAFHPTFLTKPDSLLYISTVHLDFFIPFHPLLAIFLLLNYFFRYFSVSFFGILDIQALHPAFLANTVSALYITTVHLDFFSPFSSLLTIFHLKRLAHLIVVCPSLFHLSTPHLVKQKPDKGLSNDSPLYSFYSCLFPAIFIRPAGPHTF